MLVRRIDEPEHEYELINGEGRLTSVDPETEVPVLVLDVDEQEARDLMLVIDPISAMADHDAATLTRLLGETEPDPELQLLRDQLALQAGKWEFSTQGEGAGTATNSAVQWKCAIEKERYEKVAMILRRVREANPGATTHLAQMVEVIRWWKSRRSSSKE